MSKLHEDSQLLVENELYSQIERNRAGHHLSHRNEEITSVLKENTSLKSALKEAERGWQDAISFARDMQNHLSMKDEKLKAAQLLESQLRTQIARLQHQEIHTVMHSPDFSMSSQSAGSHVSREGADRDKDTQIYMLQSELKLYRDGILSHKKSHQVTTDQMKTLATDVSLANSKLMHSVYTLFQVIGGPNSPVTSAGEHYILQKEFEKLRASSSIARDASSSDNQTSSDGNSLDVSVEHLGLLADWSTKVINHTHTVVKTLSETQKKTTAVDSSDVYKSQRSSQNDSSTNISASELEETVDRVVLTRMGLLENFIRNDDERRKDFQVRHQPAENQIGINVDDHFNLSDSASSGSEVESRKMKEQRDEAFSRRSDLHKRYDEVRRGGRFSGEEDIKDKEGFMRMENASRSHRGSPTDKHEYSHGESESRYNASRRLGSSPTQRERNQRSNSPSRNSGGVSREEGYPSAASRPVSSSVSLPVSSSYDNKQDKRGGRSPSRKSYSLDTTNPSNYNSTKSPTRKKSAATTASQQQWTNRALSPASAIRSQQKQRSPVRNKIVPRSVTASGVRERKENLLDTEREVPMTRYSTVPQYDPTGRKLYDYVGSRLPIELPSSRLFTPSVIDGTTKRRIALGSRPDRGRNGVEHTLLVLAD